MYTKNEKIGVLGSGPVGQVLAAAFLSEGHQVMLGTRNVNKDSVVKWKNEHSGAQTGSFEDTAKFGDILVLAVEGDIVKEVVKQAGKENFTGKVVLDTTNPIKKAPPVNGVLQFFTGPNESLLEVIQQELPEAKVVKAFNSVGNASMYKPDYGDIKPTMFICGNDDQARKTASAILDGFGWEVEDLGKAEAARSIEPLCMLWCIPGFLQNSWTHAFKLLRKR